MRDTIFDPIIEDDRVFTTLIRYFGVDKRDCVEVFADETICIEMHSIGEGIDISLEELKQIVKLAEEFLNK